jgi:hypothetical protein
VTGLARPTIAEAEVNAARVQTHDQGRDRQKTAGSSSQLKTRTQLSRSRDRAARLLRASNTTMATAFFRGFLSTPLRRPLLGPTVSPAVPLFASPVVRAFSTTPAPNATLNQVLRVS